MSYVFEKYLLLRRPVKNPADYAADNQTFLNDPAFRSAVYLASASFFSSLEQQGFQSKKLSDKEENTLRKYINRYCFRPTPFGLFSSISLIQWGSSPESKIQHHAEYEASIHADQTYQASFSQYLLESELADQAAYEGNPSLYRALNEYRFFRTGLNENFKQREYLLQSIAFSKLLKDLIAYCREGRNKPELIDHILQAAGSTREEAEDYIDFLTDAQLLVNRLRPNITGLDYLKRLADVNGLYHPSNSRFHSLNKVLAGNSKKMAIEPGIFQALNRQLKELAPSNQAGQHTDQLSVILYRKDDVTINSQYQQQIRDGLYALDALSPTDRLPAMESFIKSFREHFEGQTLPLLTAMDPETGIGYQEAQPEKNNPLLETLNIAYRTQVESVTSWSAAHSLLMESWLSSKSTGKAVIRLEEKELQKLKLPDEPLQIMGMSVLFRIMGDQVLIESAGGTNAPALMGRFTVADETIYQAATSMARQLEQQNPGIIFAELLQLADPHVDNVNRRESVYSYELPITAASLLPAEQQLELADLFIRIENNMAILYSEKHGKPVIPRLTSAYNHSLNKLPLFRFLADLPYQYGRFNLGLDLRQYFPGLSFYPRVAYKNSVLSPATWIIPAEQLNELQGKDSIEVLSAFKRLSDSIFLPEYFSLAEGDQQLVFNQNKNEDILFFCNCIRQKKEAVLKEFFEQTEIRQYNAYVLPGEPLNFPLSQNLTSKKEAGSTKIQRKYIPGSEWLYLKIYAPKIGADRLLLRLQPLLNKRYQYGKISKWFFIRYDDHAPHIRLRLQVSPEAISEVLFAFKTKLEDRIQQHVVREYQIDVYSRELERYAAAGMELTENFFWASSQLVLSFLKQNKYHVVVATHHFALCSTLAIIEAFIPDMNDRLEFTLSSYQQFLPEFADRRVKVGLDKKYRELAPGIIAALKADDDSLMSGAVIAGRKFTQTLRAVQESISLQDENRTSYLRSIIHMHLNRIFTDESRKQEMITYYLLYKYLLSVKARNKL